jgi:hypothetical protein
LAADEREAAERSETKKKGKKLGVDEAAGDAFEQILCSCSVTQFRTERRARWFDSTAQVASTEAMATPVGGRRRRSFGRVFVFEAERRRWRRLERERR